MGANCNTTPPLLKAIFFNYRFDLTNFDTPCQNFMGAICHVTPVLNDILDLCRYDLTYLTPCQNFTGAFCHVTPVLNDILDLCRYNLTYLTPPLKFHRCNLLCYTCVKWYFRSMQIWLDIFDPPLPKFYGCILSCYTTAVQPISIQPLQTQQKPRVTEVQHNAEKHFLFISYNNWTFIGFDIHIDLVIQLSYFKVGFKNCRKYPYFIQTFPKASLYFINSSGIYA